MRKILVHEFISLDGVIQAPGGPEEDTDGGFTQGGWARPFWHADIGARFGQLLQQTDTLLLGSKTWQIHGAAFGPQPEGDPFKGMTKYVASTTLKSVDLWPNSVLISSHAVDEIRKLKSQPGKDILMDGSSVLIHDLIRHQLIDELSLHVYPLVLGGGKRLFPFGWRMDLKLLGSTVIPTGVVYQRYQVN